MKTKKTVEPAVVRELIVSSGLSQAKMAKAIGLDVRTLRRYISEAEIPDAPYPIWLAINYVIGNVADEDVLIQK